MKPAILLVATAAMLVSGCASLTSPARKSRLDPGHSYWFDYDATRRGMVFSVSTDHAGNAVVRTCGEPAPDVAMQMVASAAVEADVPDGNSGKVQAAGAQAAKLLSERTQMVMFFREALFRVCEISMNQNLAPADVVTLYKHIIDTALKLGSDKAFDVELLVAKSNLEAHIAERVAATERVELLVKALAEAESSARKRLEEDLRQARAVEAAASTAVLKSAQLLTAIAPAAGQAASTADTQTSEPSTTQ
jgi:hypothetical protein